jgi:hypothetical protein
MIPIIKIKKLILSKKLTIVKKYKNHPWKKIVSIIKI